MSSETRPVVVLAVPAADGLALLADSAHPLAPWVERVTAVAVGIPDDLADADERGAESTVLVAALARRFPAARWFATASFSRDFPYNLARRIGSLSNTARSRVGVALVPGPTTVPTTRTATAEDTVVAGSAALSALWESWPLDSIVADRERRLFVDSSRIVRVDQDDVFAVRGPLQVPVDAARKPPIAVWADHPLPGTELAFAPDGTVRRTDGHVVGTVVSGDTPTALRALDAAGEPASGPSLDLREALGLGASEPVLVGAPAAFVSEVPR
ncbi:hypothetical protein [Microbacterium sp. B19]|uniref:hypothetical protein n=1 Tax=Microbacterium sp. B19 TaxID=96765 RepID=UPI000348BD67|nr:hypothetical protein [Microbacterium sp. B19]